MAPRQIQLLDDQMTAPASEMAHSELFMSRAIAQLAMCVSVS